MVIYRTLLAAALTMALVMPARANFEEAVEAYKRGDHETAYCELRYLAKQGHPVAQFHLGFMYETGQGVQQDYTQATKWYRLAAGQGYPEAVKWQRANQEEPWRPMPAAFLTASRESLGTKQSGELSQQAIKKIQISLARLGFDPGPLDGLMGPRTKTAIRAFEKAKGLPDVGGASRFLAAQLFLEEQLRLSARKIY